MALEAVWALWAGALLAATSWSARAWVQQAVAAQALTSAHFDAAAQMNVWSPQKRGAPNLRRDAHRRAALGRQVCRSSSTLVPAAPRQSREWNQTQKRTNYMLLRKSLQSRTVEMKNSAHLQMMQSTFVQAVVFETVPVQVGAS